MRLGVLASIGHNIADSLACGLGFIIGVYETDVFGEADAASAGCIEIDLLRGAITRGEASQSLARAVELYAEALGALCERQGVAVAEFAHLSVRFEAGPFKRFVVTVEDRRGRRSNDTYEGSPGKRVKVLDHLGRVRRK